MDRFFSVGGRRLLGAVLTCLSLLVGCTAAAERQPTPPAPALTAGIPDFEGAPALVEEALRSLGTEDVARATYRELPDQVSVGVELDRRVEQHELFSLLGATVEARPAKHITVMVIYPVEDGTGQLEGLDWSPSGDSVLHLYGRAGRPAFEDGMVFNADSVTRGLDAAALARIASGEDPVPSSRSCNSHAVSPSARCRGRELCT